MKKFMDDLRVLVSIDYYIRDSGFIATQEAIANELDVSVRKIRYHFQFMIEDLEAPLMMPGPPSEGWIYSEEWDMWEALKGLIYEG